jgi:hypothetical protein
MDIKSNCFETAAQQTTLVQRRTRLLRAIGKFRSAQATYMPGALQVLAKSTSPTEDVPAEQPEDIPLFLPSELPEAYRQEGCRAGLLDIERQLREGQLRNALHRLRNHLHMKSRLLTYRTSNVAHQGAVTRSRAIFMRNQRQIDRCTRKYQAVWTALATIVGKEEVGWRKLENKDVRLMDGEGDRAVGVKRKQKSRKGKGKEKEAEETEGDGEEEDNGLAEEQPLTQRLRDV